MCHDVWTACFGASSFLSASLQPTSWGQVARSRLTLSEPSSNISGPELMCPCFPGWIWSGFQHQSARSSISKRKQALASYASISRRFCCRLLLLLAKHVEIEWSGLGKQFSCRLPSGLMIPVCCLPRPYDQTCVSCFLTSLVELEYLDYINVVGNVNFFLWIIVLGFGV